MNEEQNEILETTTEEEQEDVTTTENETTDTTSEMEDVQIQPYATYGYSSISYSSFNSIVSNYEIDTNLYLIDLYSSSTATTPKYSFVVPTDLAEYIQVIDGVIYNFSSSTVKLTSVGQSGTEYFMSLSIPSYGSDTYYKNIAQNGTPYTLTQAYYDGGYYATTSVSYDNSYYYKNSTSQLYAWDLKTIFIFVILIILLVGSVFRKGV